MCTTECEPATAEDRAAAPLDNDVISQRHDDNQQQQQQQQQLQLQVQLKQACDREASATRQLQTANKTIEDLQERLETRQDTIQGLRYELVKAQQKETELQRQMNDADTAAVEGRSVATAQLVLRAPVADMLFAFLSYTLTTDQQSLLLDSLTAENVITAKQRAEIQRLATPEEKVLMLLSRLRWMSTNDVEQWLTTISSVGQKQLVEAKLRALCKYITVQKD